MNGINKVILIGSVGQDPKIVVTNNVKVAYLSIATNNTVTDKTTKEKKTLTEWHKIILFYKLADLAEQYIKKGSCIYIEGSLKANKYTDKNGVERNETNIVGKIINLLDKKEKSNEYQNHHTDTKAYAKTSDPFDEFGF